MMDFFRFLSCDVRVFIFTLAAYNLFKKVNVTIVPRRILFIIKLC